MPPATTTRSNNNTSSSSSSSKATMKPSFLTPSAAHPLPTRRIHALIHKTLPPQHRSLYYLSLSKYLSQSLTKLQWDEVLRNIASTCGSEILTLHNCLIKCIIYNAREVSKGSLKGASAAGATPSAARKGAAQAAAKAAAVVAASKAKDTTTTSTTTTSQQSTEQSSSAGGPLHILFRDLNNLGLPSAVSHTSRSVNIWDGYGEWVGSGVKYEGLLGEESSLVGVLPFGVLPQTHYGSTSLSGAPVPKEGIPLSTVSLHKRSREHNNMFYSSNVRILSTQGMLPSSTRHPEMYTNAAAIPEDAPSAIPPSAMHLPFRPKLQDLLPFDFGSKGWAHTSHLYGNLTTAMSSSAISKYGGTSSAPSARSIGGAHAVSLHQRDFPDLNIIKARMDRIAKTYQVEITPQCIQMMIRAMESYIKTILENCVRSKREDEFERVPRVDVDPNDFAMERLKAKLRKQKSGTNSAVEDMDSVGESDILQQQKDSSKSEDAMEDEDYPKGKDEEEASSQQDLPTEVEDMQPESPSEKRVEDNAALVGALFKDPSSNSTSASSSSSILDQKEEQDPHYGTYLRQRHLQSLSNPGHSVPALHSYYHYKDEYEHKVLQHNQEELSQHPRVNRIITVKYLLSVLQMKPELVAGNSEWSARMRAKVLHSNWDLNYDS